LALKSYTKKYDEDRKVYLSKPQHDWASHPADAFGIGVVGYREEYKPVKVRERPTSSGAWLGC
jgi:hypothetical protein